MVIFPLQLPQTFVTSSIRVQPISNAIQQDMAVGPPKTRNRDTSVHYDVSGTLLMTKTQFEEFETFFFDTIGGGVLKFQWKHPLLLTEDKLFLFNHGQSPYTVDPFDSAGTRFYVALKLFMMDA